jgi:hypothetical protein
MRHADVWKATYFFKIASSLRDPLCPSYIFVAIRFAAWTSCPTQLTVCFARAKMVSFG